MSQNNTYAIMSSYSTRCPRTTWVFIVIWCQLNNLVYIINFCQFGCRPLHLHDLQECQWCEFHQNVKITFHQKFTFEKWSSSLDIDFPRFARFELILTPWSSVTHSRWEQSNNTIINGGNTVPINCYQIPHRTQLRLFKTLKRLKRYKREDRRAPNVGQISAFAPATLRLLHFHFHTFTYTLSHFHFHTFTLSLSHFHFHTFTLSHFHTFTFTL